MLGAGHWIPHFSSNAVHSLAQVRAADNGYPLIATSCST